jgi:pyrroloquinoline-quinone synthase
MSAVLTNDANSEAREFRIQISEELTKPPYCLALHPVIEKLERRELTQAQIAGWMGQIYRQTVEVVRWLGYCYAKCPIMSVRREIFNNLVEEELGGFSNTDAHFHLAARVAVAAGAKREDLDHVPLMPETKAAIEYGQEIYIREPNWLIGLGGGFGFETQSPACFDKIGRALRKSYGFTSEQTTFFDVHVEADADHGDAIIALFEKYATTREERADFRNKALTMSERYWGMLSTYKYF